jgi:hypothetical protein
MQFRIVNFTPFEKVLNDLRQQDASPRPGRGRDTDEGQVDGLVLSRQAAHRARLESPR